VYAVSDLLELNQNMPVPERWRIARKLTFVGASPPERRQDSALGRDARRMGHPVDGSRQRYGRGDGASKLILGRGNAFGPQIHLG